MDQPETKLPTEAEIIAPTTGKVSTYTDPVTREKTKFESYGQVTRDGVYAGDGFEWYEMDVKGSDGAPVLGRRYTGEGEDNNLGQDTIIATELGYGDPADRDVFALLCIMVISISTGVTFAYNDKVQKYFGGRIRTKLALCVYILMISCFPFVLPFEFLQK